MKKITTPILGMHCASCAQKIESTLKKLNDVIKANVNFATEKATVKYDPTKTDINTIMNAIKNAGYQSEEINLKESKGFF